MDPATGAFTSTERGSLVLTPRRAGLVLASCLFGVCAFAQNATVTANLKQLGGGAAQPTGASIRVDLQNCAAPRVPGTGNIGEKTRTFYPNTSGVVTVTLYSNSVLDCGQGVLANPVSFYSFNLVSNGQVTSLGSYKVPVGSTTLDTLTPINTTPVINTPTGDSSYLRLDLGNWAELAGSFPPIRSLNGVLNAATFAGSDIGAQINAAFASSGGPNTVTIPPGNYSFSTTITIPNDQYHLDCSSNTNLTYTGSGDAIVLVSGGQGAMGVDGHGGCHLNGTSNTGTGVHIEGLNDAYVTGMRIANFAKGINVAAGNNIQIFNDAFKGNTSAVYATTIPGFAPNALHIHDNEFSNNGWGYQSVNSGASASHGLGNVIRDNVFEGQTTGDIGIGWDSHLIITGNYFESAGVNIAVGNGPDNVFDVQIKWNYFTAQAATRSEIELGYGFDFYIEHNYEEGTVSDSSGCKINITSGGSGGLTNIRARDAFAYHQEGGITTPPTPHDMCNHGTPTNQLPGTEIFQDAVQVNGAATVFGQFTANGNASLLFGAQLGTSLFDGVATTPAIGGACSPEGYLLVSSTSPAHISFCSGGFWRAIY
jgi:hypothetical protein